MFSLPPEVGGYRIKSVAQMAGVTTHAIRKWEKRYHLFSPRRSHNGYRLYSDQDLQFLMYLKSQLDAGKTIGQLAAKGPFVLKEIIESAPLDVSEVSPTWRESALTVIHAARKMDERRVERIFQDCFKKLGVEKACITVIFPLLRVVGELWHQGKVTISSEHLLSQTVRRLLAETILSPPNRERGPTVIVGCIPNDFHDIGAITAAAILQQNGWRTFYLGPNADLEVIRLACVKRQSHLVVLACVIEQSPEEMNNIITAISKIILPICSVIVGGDGALEYRDCLKKHHIRLMRHLEELKSMTPKTAKIFQPLAPN